MVRALTPVENVDEIPEVVAPTRGLPGQRLSAAAQRATPWQGVLAVMVIAYTWYFTKISIDVHQGLGTSSYDVGLYDQGVWLMSRFKAPFVTLMGRNLMGDHTSFILVFLAPFYWLFPSINTLFFFQSLALGMGALPVFLYARHKLESERLAVVLAGCYLLHPAVSWANRENFHPDSFLGVFIGMAIYGALVRKWRLYAVFVVLALLVKEDVSLVVVPLGVWVALKRDRRIGLATIGGALGLMLFAMFAVMKSLIGVPTRNGWRIPFGGPTGLLRETVERPGNVIDHFRADGRPFYVWQMTFPLSLVFLRRPGVALIGGVVLGTNILSTYFYQYHIEYHYSLIIVPALAMGTVYALGEMGPRLRQWLTGSVAVTSLWACLMWGALPIGVVLAPWVHPTLGRPLPGYWAPDYPVAVAARDLMAKIPDDASVAAYHALDPHLSHREQIYQFPNPFRVVLYGPNTDLERARACLTTANDIQYVMLPVSLGDMQPDWDRVKADFSLVESNESWNLFHRVGHSVTCARSAGEQYPTLRSG